MVFCHGFPHIWFSWHRQMRALAEAGYRAIAPDMRGMGQSAGPSDAAGYGVDVVTGDLLALLEHAGEDKAVFVGFGFWRFAVYDFAMRHPDKLLGVIGLENPAAPHNPDKPPLVEYAEMAERHFVHIEYFRPVGPADAALDASPREFLSKLFYALSGDYHYLDVWKYPPGTPYLEALPEPPPLPWGWLSELELEFFVNEYARSGFTGGLNWYRSMDLKWEQRRPYEGKTSPVPAHFIGSERDADLEGLSRCKSSAAVPRSVPRHAPRRYDQRWRPHGAAGKVRRGQPAIAGIPRRAGWRIGARQRPCPLPASVGLLGFGKSASKLSVSHASSRS